MKHLMHNIKAYTNCILYGYDFRFYSSRIDYHLDALNYNFFDYTRETAKELTERLGYPPDRTDNKRPPNSRTVIISHDLLPRIAAKKFKKVPKTVIRAKPKRITEKTSSLIDQYSKMDEDPSIETVHSDEDDDSGFKPKYGTEMEETELKDHLEDDEDCADETKDGEPVQDDSSDSGGEFSD